MIAARPDLAIGLSGRSFVHLRQKQYAALVDDLTRQAEVDDDEDARIYVLLADANMLKGDLVAASGDADKLVSLAPDSTLGYVIRGRVNIHQTRYDRAEEAFNRALRLQPESVSALFGMGIAHWSAREFVDAAHSFDSAASLAPKDAYSLLWLGIARATAHKSNDDLPARAKTFDLAEWPGPLVSLYGGSSTPEAAVAAARAGDPDDVALHVCEAEFYAGEWQLQGDAKDAAVALLSKAAQDCAPNDTEWDAAGIELKRLRS